jgi:hypothetical protein
LLPAGINNRLITASGIILLSLGATCFSKEYAEVLGRLFQSLIPFIYDRFDVYQIAITEGEGELGYQLLANNTQPITVGKILLPPNLGVTAITLAAHSIQHILFMGLVLLGALFYFPLNRLKIFIFSIPTLLILELIDIPMVLTGSIEDLLLFQFDQGEYNYSARIHWMNFLNNGGRLGLSMVAAWILAISCQQKLCTKSVTVDAEITEDPKA